MDKVKAIMDWVRACAMGSGNDFRQVGMTQFEAFLKRILTEQLGGAWSCPKCGGMAYCVKCGEEAILTEQLGECDENGNHFIEDEVRLGDWCFLDCDCEYCTVRRKEIAKRKIDEYINKNLIPKNTNAQTFITGIKLWLEEGE